MKCNMCLHYFSGGKKGETELCECDRHWICCEPGRWKCIHLYLTSDRKHVFSADKVKDLVEVMIEESSPSSIVSDTTYGEVARFPFVIKVIELAFSNKLITLYNLARLTGVDVFCFTEDSPCKNPQLIPGGLGFGVQKEIHW